MLHADKGIFGFVPKLLTSPGLIALDYVQGRRKKYFNPFQYLILVVGFSVFLITKLKYLEQSATMMNPSKLPPRVALIQHEILEFMNHYFNLVIFLLIPIFAIMSFLFFKKKGFNYAENVVLQCCIQAQQNTISLVTLLFVAVFRNPHFLQAIVVFSVIVVCITSAFGYKQFFKVSFGQALWKAIVIYLLVQLLMGIIVAVVVGILVLAHPK